MKISFYIKYYLYAVLAVLIPLNAAFIFCYIYRGTLAVSFGSFFRLTIIVSTLFPIIVFSYCYFANFVIGKIFRGKHND
jgi:hypothetical protein